MVSPLADALTKARTIRRPRTQTVENPVTIPRLPRPTAFTGGRKGPRRIQAAACGACGTTTRWPTR